ncbi:hypothetical protein [Myroides fluvii]|uniref:hypothetical protein n=1 Tax=Myroides fluvii TaxID=2572594 RepID=UPI00131B0C63|nr:hypothetical protein [Myroides fluvii]
MKQLFKIHWLLSFLFTGYLFGQVGIHNEKPEADLDVKGEVRLRKLANPIEYNRMILADEHGNLGYNDLGEDAYTAKDVLFKNLPQSVSTTLVNNSNAVTMVPVELNLDLVVKIEPRTTVAVALEYNVSITGVLTNINTPVPGYMGITLYRSENNIQTELEEGSRKFTLYNVPKNYGSERHITMPVSGKATDIFTNLTTSAKYITYSAKGYVENGRGTMFFGSPVGADENYGTGVFIIQIYEKKL